MQLFEAIWRSKLTNTDITQVQVSNPLLVNGIVTGRWFVNGTLRGFDFDVNINGKILQLRILEQNPNKRDMAGNLSHYANLAQQGHKICWLIDKNGSFLGRVQNGEWHFSQPRATTPAQYNQPNTYQPTQPNYQTAGAGVSNVSQTDLMDENSWDTEMIPDIPDNVDIPDAVLNHFANIDEDPPDDLD
jgi:hypothetical protein